MFLDGYYKKNWFNIFLILFIVAFIPLMIIGYDPESRMAFFSIFFLIPLILWIIIGILHLYFMVFKEGSNYAINAWKNISKKENENKVLIGLIIFGIFYYLAFSLKFGIETTFILLAVGSILLMLLLLFLPFIVPFVATAFILALFIKLVLFFLNNL